MTSYRGKAVTGQLRIGRLAKDPPALAQGFGFAVLFEE